MLYFLKTNANYRIQGLYVHFKLLKFKFNNDYISAEVCYFSLVATILFCYVFCFVFVILVFIRKGKMYEIQLLIILHFKIIKVSNNISSQKSNVFKKRGHSRFSSWNWYWCTYRYSLNYSISNNLWTQIA